MHCLKLDEIKPILRMIRHVKRNLFQFTVIEYTLNVMSNKNILLKPLKSLPFYAVYRINILVCKTRFLKKFETKKFSVF